MTFDATVEVAAIAAGSAVIVALVGLVGTWIASRKTREKVEEVRLLAEPTGNGYAEKTLTALARIEDRQLIADRRHQQLAEAFEAHRVEHRQPPRQGTPPVE